MKRRTGIICLAALLLTGCGHKSPQIPSQRKGEAPAVDSAAIALMEMHQQLAFAADREVTKAAQLQGEPFAIYEAKTWMYISDRGDLRTGTPQEGERRVIRMQVCTLEGTLLEDSEHSYRIHKGELPAAVDDNIGELHSGGKARLIAPWYSAFGAIGTAHVPPYENVIIDIELK